jgi:hypothetical protein
MHAVVPDTVRAHGVKMSQSKSRWVNVLDELRDHPKVRVGTMIGFLVVSMPAAWLLSVLVR